MICAETNYGIFQLSRAELNQLLDDIDGGKYPDGKYKVTYALDWSTYKYKVQINETDCVKMQAVYQYMYCLAYGFGEVVDQDIANLKTPPYSTYLGNPLDYIDKDVWQKASDYFDGLTGKGLATGDHTNAQIYVLIDGVLTSNFLQNTAFSLENYIVLNRVDPEKPPVTPEEPGTPPPAGPGTPGGCAGGCRRNGGDNRAGNKGGRGAGRPARAQSTAAGTRRGPGRGVDGGRCSGL